jgi:hypothetical protein
MLDMRRGSAWMLGLPVALVAIVAGGFALHSGQASGHSYAQYHGPLTAEEYAYALKVAEHDYHARGNHITFATATIHPGTVPASNLSGRCTSGHVLTIRLAGTFPGSLALDGLAGESQSGPDTMAVYKADASTGQASLVSQVTGGPFTRNVHAANLLPALHAS